jgi:hypothetical protein
LFKVDPTLLREATRRLQKRGGLSWVLGAAGAGKSTVCQMLRAQHGLEIYDMDAHIYGDYHHRYDPKRHPANSVWSTAPESLSWTLDLGWEEFDAFSRAALVEYLDLLAEDLEKHDRTVIIDGGGWHPEMIARAIGSEHLAVLSGGARGRDLWESADRIQMRAYFKNMTDPDGAWEIFLDYDQRIASTLMEECRRSNLALLNRTDGETPEDLGRRVAEALRL